MKIFLIGFMGSGKTFLGKKWAKEHKMKFIDLDELIEKKAGLEINEIFEKHGEKYFRLLESQVLRSLEKKRNIIISCGGGTPCFNNNMDWMNEHGITLYLKVRVDELVRRLMIEKYKRPLIKDIPNELIGEYVERELSKRKVFYKEARIIFGIMN